MDARIKRNKQIKVILLFALLMAIIPFLGDNAHAAPSDDWRAVISGEDPFSFYEGWEYGGCSGDNCAYRSKHIDANTILEEVFGEGEYQGGGNIPANGETLIVNVRGEFTSISDGAFDDPYSPSRKTYLKEITLTDSITKIGARAFYGCKALSSIKLPNRLTRIGEEAFYGCTGLASINLPSKLQYIDYKAFNGCNRLVSITTPASTKNVADDAFYGCSGLSSLTFYGNNAVIGNCIGNCPNIKTLTVGKGIKTISETYNDFKKLETISLNTNTTYKKNGGTFISDETTATKVIFTGTGIIKDLNFTWQPKIKNVVISNGVSGIGKSAFGYWEHIEKITVPASVKTIDAEAFYGCKRLKVLTIGSGATKLGKHMVDECGKLKTITIKTKKLKKKTVKGCLSGSKVKTVKIKVGSKKANKKYVKKYKKLFTKKNAGRKVTVK